MQTLPYPCLCLVTDRRLCAGSLDEKVAAAVSGGVDVVQLREKDMPGGDLLELALRLRAVTEGKALLIINDRLDVALAAGAGGLHLPEASLPVCDAKRVAPSELLVGKSIHGLSAASLASKEGADYLVLGTIFPTASKPGAETGGLDLLSRVASQVDTPILAIGGIDFRNVGSVMESGAQGAAVVSAILGSPDPEGAARELKQLMSAAAESRAAQPSHS